MTDFDRVARFMGQPAMEQLKSKKVAVVGLGSGGGFVAVSLAMSGVGQFVLIDDDVLEPTNVVRHVADLRHLRMPKVEAVAGLIKARNPDAEVTVIVGRLEHHPDVLAGCDLVISGVDAEGPKYLINETCRALGLTAVYAGVYERGEGGDVVIIHPSGEGPCYACWALQLREEVIDQGPGDTQIDYGLVTEHGTIRAEPALWLHVTRVAGVQADFALNALLEGTPAFRPLPANTVILANVAMEIIEGRTVHPYSSEWVNIRRDPGCLVCGTRDEANSAILSLETLLADQHEPDASTGTQADTENRTHG
jgi:molybdopterin/thiamine biosynthesis adenylyltransferase